MTKRQLSGIYLLVLTILLTLVMFGGVLPSLISSANTVDVWMGVACGLVFTAAVVHTTVFAIGRIKPITQKDPEQHQ